MTEQSKFVTTAEGNRLFATHRSGTGTPVLFLNSIAADHTMWDAVRDRLTVPSIAFDARGHGASEVVPGTAYIEDLAADAIAVMDAMGADRVILCGLSLGGPTALRIAQIAPERVAGLALANTRTKFGPPKRWRDRAADLRAGKMKDMIQPTLERWVTEAWRNENPEGVAKIRSMLEATPAEGYAAACAALESVDLTDVLEHWEGPALFIAGRHDNSTTVSDAQDMLALCPQATLVVLDAAHISSVEAPAEFAEALERLATSIS